MKHKIYMKLHIWHHLGLGDHILCNGLVRSYAENNDIILFVKKRNLTNVKRMFRDLTNIIYISGLGEQDQFVNHYLDINKYIRLLKVTAADSANFDKELYKSGAVPFNYKYSKFYFERDLDKEQELFKQIVGLDKEYIFIHHTYVNPIKLKTNLRIINAHDYKDINIFDWGLIIERAKEIHVENSSFLNLIDLAYDIKGTYHSYLRPSCDLTLTPNKWITI